MKVCYAMSGTDIQLTPIELRHCYAMSDTEIHSEAPLNPKPDTRHQVELAVRLETAEQEIEARQLEIASLRDQLQGDGAIELRDNAVLRDENASLEQELRATGESNKLLQQQLQRLQVQLKTAGPRGGGGGDGDEISEPNEDAPPKEHAVRKRMQKGRGGAVDKSDVAEFALIWGLQPAEESYLMWMPEKALQAPLPPGWSEAIDRRGDTFYYETGSGFSTYHHPNDTKYKEMAMELKRQLAKRLEAGPATDESLELERLRLREANAAVERQARELKEQEAALDRRKMQAAQDVKTSDEERVKEWEAHREEILKQELKTLREEETVRAEKARERQVVEVREEMYTKERQTIRDELLEEEKERLAVERLKLRQRIIKEETAAFRKTLEEEEAAKVEAMRAEVASELKDAMLAEEKAKLAKKDDGATPHHKHVRDAKDAALEMQIQAAKLKQASMDEVTKREVEEYAEYLGMDREKDTHLFWIAEMALTAPLPVGWTEHQDSSGNIFFFNRDSGMSTYEHPMDASFKAYYARIKANGQ